MEDKNPEGASQASFAKEVLNTLEAVAFKKGELKPLFEKVETNPENYSTSEQLGNALKSYMKNYEKNKYNEAAATLANRYDKAMAMLFPDVTFDKGAKLEDNLKIIKSHFDSDKSEENQELKEQITDRQIANDPRYQTLKAKVEKQQSMIEQLESENQRTKNKGEVIASVHSAISDLENPLDLSDDPLRRKRQLDALINDLSSLKYQTDEKGSLVKGDDGYPIPVDDNGDPLYDKENNKDIGFAALVPKYSLVGFKKLKPEEPEDKTGMRDFRGKGNDLIVPKYCGEENDADYLTLIRQASEKGNFQLARAMQQKRAEFQQSSSKISN